MFSTSVEVDITTLIRRYYYINMPLIKQSILYLRGKLKIAMVLILKSLKISYCARLLIIRFKCLILGAFYLLIVSYNKVKLFLHNREGDPDIGKRMVGYSPQNVEVLFFGTI